MNLTGVMTFSIVPVEPGVALTKLFVIETWCLISLLCELMLTRLIQTNGVTNVTVNSRHWSEPKMQRKAAMEKVQSCD